MLPAEKPDAQKILTPISGKFRVRAGIAEEKLSLVQEVAGTRRAKDRWLTLMG